MNVPNTITLLRVVLAIGTIALLFGQDQLLLKIACGLTLLVIWGDGLDGYFARKLNQTTKLGAVLDIAGDRAVEMMYWIAFATLGWISVSVPLIFLIRGTFVDAIRAQAGQKGFTAFGENTMMQSRIGKFLVASNFSRFTYAVTKALAFCLVILAHILPVNTTVVPLLASWCVWIATIFCLLRGIPVLFEARELLQS